MSWRAFLSQRERCARITRELALASSAGCEPVVVLGAEQLLFSGSRGRHFETERRALERDAVELCAALVARDERSPAELFAGICYAIDAHTDRPAGNVIIRLATLEETARAWSHRLRSGSGLHLRRAQANRLAETLDALTARSRQAVRTASSREREG